MEYLEGGAIKMLKGHLRKYYDDPENEQLRINVETEVKRLIDIADAKRTQETGQDLTDQNEERKEYEKEDNSSQYGNLGWLSKLIDLSDVEN